VDTGHTLVFEPVYYPGYIRAIGAIGARSELSELSDTIGHYRSNLDTIVHEHLATGSTIGHYRREHYRTIGQGTIGLSELSDHYRSAIGVHYRTIGPGLRSDRTSVHTTVRCTRPPSPTHRSRDSDSPPPARVMASVT